MKKKIRRFLDRYGDALSSGKDYGKVIDGIEKEFGSEVKQYMITMLIDDEIKIKTVEDFVKLLVAVLVSLD